LRHGDGNDVVSMCIAMVYVMVNICVWNLLEFGTRARALVLDFIWNEGILHFGSGTDLERSLSVNLEL
jgi:hypothetical protein